MIAEDFYWKMCLRFSFKYEFLRTFCRSVSSQCLCLAVLFQEQGKHVSDLFIVGKPCYYNTMESVRGWEIEPWPGVHEAPGLSPTYKDYVEYSEM